MLRTVITSLLVVDTKYAMEEAPTPTAEARNRKDLEAGRKEVVKDEVVNAREGAMFNLAVWKMREAVKRNILDVPDVVYRGIKGG